VRGGGGREGGREGGRGGGGVWGGGWPFTGARAPLHAAKRGRRQHCPPPNLFNFVSNRASVLGAWGESGISKSGERSSLSSSSGFGLTRGRAAAVNREGAGWAHIRRCLPHGSHKGKGLNEIARRTALSLATSHYRQLRRSSTWVVDRGVLAGAKVDKGQARVNRCVVIAHVPGPAEIRIGARPPARCRDWRGCHVSLLIKIHSI
jgi:hypothetical protein